MWIPTAVVVYMLTVKGPYADLRIPEDDPRHPVFDNPPAMTQEACYIAALDVLQEEERLQGRTSMIDVYCEKVPAV